MFSYQHHHINQPSLLTRLEQPVLQLKSKPFVSFISPTSMALILAACRDHGSLSISGRPRSVSFDGQAVIGSTGDDPALDGTPLRDFIIDHEGVNIINAQAGNDYILVRGTVNADEGNDIVKSDGNNDVLNGGDGNDVLVASSGVVNGGDHDDYIQISFNDNFAMDYEQQAEVSRGNFNGKVSIDFIIDKNPLGRASEGTSTADGGKGNDIIFLASKAADTEMNKVTGGEGNDRLIVAQDSRITGGPGDDQFFLFFGNDNIEKDADDEVIDVFDDDLYLEITDFGDGSDKIMLVVNYNTQADFIDNDSSLIALFTPGTLIDHDSNGVLDDLEVIVSTEDSESSVTHVKTIIFKDLGRPLDADDFEILSLDDYNQMVDEIQQSYLDMF